MNRIKQEMDFEEETENEQVQQIGYLKEKPITDGIKKVDLESVKWKKLVIKRGCRKGVYPKWARIRKKVYKQNEELSTFSSVIKSQLKSLIRKQVKPVDKSKSQTSVLSLRPPNSHEA